MHWEVSLEHDKKLELLPVELLDALLSKQLDSERQDHTVLALELAKFLQHREAMADATVNQMLLMALSLGYFYRVFLEKNEVEVINANDKDATEQPSETPST